MTLRVNSSAFRPRYESAPYRQAPARRHWIHGPIQPMHSPRKPALLLMLLASFVVGVMIYMGGY